MIVLDTNVVSESVKRHKFPAVETWLASISSEDLALTAVTFEEIEFGINLITEPTRAALLRARYRGFASNLPILDFDADAAGHCAELRAERQRRGRRIELADAQIAGITRAHGATLATRNVRDFADCGITLIDPWQERT